MTDSTRSTPVLPPSDCRLRCRAGSIVHIHSDGGCEVDTPRGRTRFGPHALSVLGAFATPRTVPDATAVLERQLAGNRAALELLATIVELYKQGVLEQEGERPEFSRDADREGFGAVPLHVAMLEDAARTSAWLEAVGQVVRSGDVVVDLGTGTGILAIAAARAGARRVFAIEATTVAAVAEAMVQQNGVADRVTVIRGWSSQVHLPEPGDVMVTEILGDNPFGESVLESAADAFRRLLKPGARRIPTAIRVFAVPVELPPAELERHTVTARLLENWRERYGLDFSALSRATERGTMVGVKPGQARSWRRLGTPREVVRVELDADTPARIDEAVDLPVLDDGECQGVLTFFEAELCPGLVVSTDPEPNSGSHWLNPTLLLSTPRPVRAGGTLRLRYRYPATPALELIE